PPTGRGGCCRFGGRLRRIVSLVVVFLLFSRSKLPSHRGRWLLPALWEASLSRRMAVILAADCFSSGGRLCRNVGVGAIWVLSSRSKLPSHRDIPAVAM